MRCKFCESNDLVKATVKKTSKVIAVCRECDSVYELDEKENPIMDLTPSYIPHFKSIQKIFKSWKELANIVPYNKVEEEAK